MDEQILMPRRLRVAAVEDDHDARALLSATLADSGVLDVAGTCANAEEAMAHVPAWAPDVVLVDIGLPGMSGVELVAELASRPPEMRFLMLTLNEDPHVILRALRAGAHGYVLKGCSTSELIAAIREAHDGGMPFSPGVARRVREHFMGLPATASAEEGLSGQEIEVLKHLTKGRSIKEVASEMNVSWHTVRTYLKRIYAKLKVRNSREAVVRFLGKSGPH